MPSSTINAVLPASGQRGREPPERSGPPFELARSRADDRCELLRADVRPADHVVVDDAHAVLADRAHRELRLRRQPDLADEDHVERHAERGRHLVGDRHPTPGSPSTTSPAVGTPASFSARRRPASARSWKPVGPPRRTGITSWTTSRTPS